MNNCVIDSEIRKFNLNLAGEKDIRNFLIKLQTIASRFTFLEEEHTPSNSFAIILSLVEQYKHELLAGPNDQVRARKIS